MWQEHHRLLESPQYTIRQEEQISILRSSECLDEKLPSLLVYVPAFALKQKALTSPSTIFKLLSQQLLVGQFICQSRSVLKSSATADAAAASKTANCAWFWGACRNGEDDGFQGLEGRQLQGA